MKKLQESIFINASREKVWDTMLEQATYGQWTKPFNAAGSSYEGDWSAVGSTIKFIGPDPETGKDGGMIARVEDYRKPEYVAVEHYGIVKDGVEDTTSEEVKKWVPAIEAYTLIEKDGGTQLNVEVDTPEEYLAMFEDMWPKALQELKRIAEQ